jgi:CheY-like chemotaxis protein
MATKIKVNACADYEMAMRWALSAEEPPNNHVSSNQAKANDGKQLPPDARRLTARNSIMEQRVRVLIGDHQVHIRQGLQALLAAWPEIEVVGLAANGVELVQQVEKYQPEVALMDIPTGIGMERLEVVRLIKSRWPRVRIVVLTMYTTHRAAALAAGADAFLLKGSPAEALRDALLKIG